MSCTSSLTRRGARDNDTHMIMMGVLTILAIIVGPVIAVWVTRIIDRDRAAEARKMDIFRTLMRTRGMPIHRDHVGALNLVEVEFIDHEDVIKTWKKYLAHLNERPPKENDELAAFGNKRDTLLTALIDAIAKALSIKVAQLDILQGNYVPRGWSADEEEQRWLRHAIMNVLSSGKGSIPIKIRADDDSPPGQR